MGTGSEFPIYTMGITHEESNPKTSLFFPLFSIPLTARTPNVSKEHMEEFKAHLQCLGFTEDEVFYTSTEVQIPLWGG